MYRLNFILIALALGACADATDVPPTMVEPEAQEPGVSPEAMQPPQVGGPAPVDPVTSARELVIVGSNQVLLTPGDSYELQVDYLDANGVGIANQMVSAAFVGESGSTRLEARNAQTDAAGRATVFLRGGLAGERARLEVSGEGAASVYWDLVVARADGSLSVSIEVEGQVRTTGALVSVYPTGACDPAARGARYAEVFVEGVDQRAFIENLADGAEVSVLVEVSGATGTVATGCVDGLTITGLTEVTVVARMRALEFKGRYEVEHAFDLSGLIPGGEEGLLHQVARIGGGLDGSRGRAIVDLVCEHADLNVVVCTGLRALGGPVIDRVIEDQVDPALLDALTAFGDVYRIITAPEVLAEIEFINAAPDASGMLTGNEHRFMGVRLIWRDGCEARRLEDCSRDFDVDRAAIGHFDATVDGGRIEIGAHQMSLGMERIALLAAEQWLLPATLGRQGPVTLEDLATELLPCDAIAAELPMVSEGLCQDILPGALAGLVRRELEAMGGVDVVELSGDADLRDADRRVSGFTGDWTGPTLGSFTAERLQ